MKEEFRDVKGFKGVYQISNLGRVKSFQKNKETILKQNDNGAGYKQVVLCINKTKKTYKTHSLVAIHFLNHKPCGHKTVVHHKNNDTNDNRLINLEVTTQRKNTYTHHKGTSKYRGVSFNKKSNKWQSRIYINKKSYYLGMFNCETMAFIAYSKKLNEILI